MLFFRPDYFCHQIGDKMQFSKGLAPLSFACISLALTPAHALDIRATSDARIDALILMLLGYHDGSPEQFIKLGEGNYSILGDSHARLQVVETEPCTFLMTSSAEGHVGTTVTFHAKQVDTVTYEPVGTGEDGPRHRYALQISAGSGLQTDLTGMPVQFFERSTIETDKTLAEMQSNARFLLGSCANL